MNVVAPGPTHNVMMASVPEELRAALTAPIPLGRMACPQELAAATLFLLSDEASFVVGPNCASMAGCDKSSAFTRTGDPWKRR